MTVALKSTGNKNSPGLLARLWNVLNPVEGSLGNELFRATFFYSPIVTPLLLCFINGFEYPREKWLTGFVIGLTVSYTCIGTIALVSYVIEPALMRLLGRPVREHSRSWWFSLSLCVIPLGMFFGFKVNTLAHRHLGPILGLKDFGVEKYEPTFADYRIGLLVGTLIAGGFFLLSSRREAKENLHQKELHIKDLENQHLTAQLSALTAQMNPHLMFNALNTVAALVPTDPEKAEETIIKLSELYRGVLSSSQTSTHTLAKELEICSAYLAVEKARFGERLQASIEVAANVAPEHLQVPALCLQPLVENSIKHGLSPRLAGGAVQIKAARNDKHLSLDVSDDGVGFASAQITPHSQTGSGTALKNCRQRLFLHYGEAANFQILDRENGGSIVRLMIPLKAGALRC